MPSLAHTTTMPPMTPDRGTRSTVMVVDDQATSRQILAEIIRQAVSGVEVVTFEGGEEAMAWLEDHRVDLIVADYKMPNMDGVDLVLAVRGSSGGAEIPIVIVTIVEDREVRYRALEAGATDFLTKPVDRHECAARCRNLLTLRRQQRLIQTRAERLEQDVAYATQEVRDRERETLLRLAKAGEFRDEETFNHVLRVKSYARLIATELGFPEEEADVIGLAATLHDIGKVGIPDGILLKMGGYTTAERKLMEEHTRIGHDILKDSPSKYLQTGAIIALNHHERFDGEGYPGRLAGDDIPMAARIVSVADVFDALVSRRPYKQPWALDDAFNYLRDESGTRFDPACVEVFLAKRQVVIGVHTELQEPGSR